VSYEISSRQISKKSHFLAFYVLFLVFFTRFAGKNAFLDGFLVVFTVVQPLVWLLDPPFFTGSSGHPSHVYFI